VLLHIAATHANGSLKSRETTVSRHQLLSALFQDHRVPHAAYDTRPIGAILRPFSLHLRRRRSHDAAPVFTPRGTTRGSTASALSAVARPPQLCLPTPSCASEAEAVDTAQQRTRASQYANDLCMRARLDRPPSVYRTSYGASRESGEDSPWNSLAPSLRG
jgi:hypothetical protein